MFKVITRSLLALFIAISSICLAGCSGSARGGTTACTAKATAGLGETASGSDCLPGPEPAENLDVEILGIDPPEGPVGTKVTISVKDADKDADTVFLGATEVEATFNDADDTYEFLVPQVAADSFNIYVKNEGVKSNEVAFTVTETETPAPPAPPPDGGTPDEPASARIVTNSLTDCVYNADCPQELRARGGDTYEWEIEGLPRGMQKQPGDRSSRVNIVGRPTELGNAFKVKVTLRATKDGVAIGGDEKELELTVSQSIAINPYQTQTGADAIPIEKRNSFMVRTHIEMRKQAASTSSPAKKYIIEIPFEEKLELRVIGNAPPEGYIWKIETGKVECDDDQPCDITSSDLSITGSGKTVWFQAAPDFVGKQFQNLQIKVTDEFGNYTMIMIDKIKFLKDPCTELSIGTDSSGEDFKLGEKLSLERTATFTVKGGKGPFIWKIVKKDDVSINQREVVHYRNRFDYIAENGDYFSDNCKTVSKIYDSVRFVEGDGLMSSVNGAIIAAAPSSEKTKTVRVGAYINEFSYLDEIIGNFSSTYDVVATDLGCLAKQASHPLKVDYSVSDKIFFNATEDGDNDFMSELAFENDGADPNSRIDMSFLDSDGHEVGRWLHPSAPVANFKAKKSIITKDRDPDSMAGTEGQIDIRNIHKALIHIKHFKDGSEDSFFDVNKSSDNTPLDIYIRSYEIAAGNWCGIMNLNAPVAPDYTFGSDFSCEDHCDYRKLIYWRVGPAGDPCKRPL